MVRYPFDLVFKNALAESKDQKDDVNEDSIKYKRHNLLDHHMAMLLYVFVESGLFEVGHTNLN